MAISEGSVGYSVVVVVVVFTVCIKYIVRSLMILKGINLS